MTREQLWARQNDAWRDPAQVAGWWGGGALDPRLLAHDVQGAFWSVLRELGVLLLITREYEHLVLALHARSGRPSVSYLPVPHPSGLAVDRDTGRTFIASTRNPNTLVELRPLGRSGTSRKGNPGLTRSGGGTLLPTATTFYPGSLYLHDLAFVGGALHGNAVGRNSIVRLDLERGLDADGYRDVWWPRCAARRGIPRTDRNYLQLNSIAAGGSLEASFFSASTDRIATRRPGHRNFPVDGRGVIFSGATREPICRGLTRPHSARLHEGRVWVDNSGYGQVGYAEEERFVSVAELPGWTRGLCFAGDIALVGTSRVLPRFRQYAPGLDVKESRCGVHAIDTRTGRVLGSLCWPWGNQVFAIDFLPLGVADALPFALTDQPRRRRDLFYAYSFQV